MADEQRDGIGVVAAVDEATVERLLTVGGETQNLDYKKKVDLSDTRTKVHLAYDLANMAAQGGHILVGANDDGTASGDVTEADLKALDEANLQQVLGKWLPQTLRMTVGRHVRADGSRVALIYVHPQRRGLSVMQVDGQYPDPKDSTKMKILFREGEVVARKGTRNGRMSQHEVEVAIDRAIQHEVDEARERWRAEVLSTLLEAQALGSAGTRVAQASSGALDWQLPLDVLSSATTELIRHKDLAPLRLLLLSTPRNVSAALREESPEISIDELLDRLTTIAATALVLDDDETFRSALEALVQVYEYLWDASGYPRADLLVSSTEVALKVIEHVEALGGLLVRLRKFKLVRTLVLASPPVGALARYRNWIRHGVVQASRDRRMAELHEDGSVKDVELPTRAERVVARLESLRPDYASDDAAILDSICQFDALACLVGMEDGGSPDKKYFYPNFAKYYPQRVLPILERLVSNWPMRDALGLDDFGRLAANLKVLLDLVENEAFPRPWNWESTPIGQFVHDHGTAS